MPMGMPGLCYKLPGLISVLEAIRITSMLIRRSNLQVMISYLPVEACASFVGYRGLWLQQFMGILLEAALLSP